MTQFQIGDEVRVAKDYDHHPGEVATVSRPAFNVLPYETTVMFAGDTGRWFVKTDSLTLVPDLYFPSVFTREVIVVDFGDAQIELTTEEANKLIRDLELAVA